MSDPVFCDGLDVARNADGEIFLRLWKDGCVVAVAGFSAERALDVTARIHSACEATFTGVPTTERAIH